MLIALVWFVMLGYRDLMGPDEGRYAEIPREMVESGDWITPRLNGFKYFEKPAFQYWMTAAGFAVFGENNATARLWVALISFLGALWVMYVGGRLWGVEAGLYGFLILSSSLMYYVLGHHITLDMTVGVFLAGGVGSLLIAQTGRQDPVRVRNWMLVGWAMLALATLTKGLIGIVLPGGVVLIYSLWQRDWALWRHLHLGKGVLLFLGITAPWFIAVSLANPEFAEFFFIHEHFDRYTSTVHRRDQPAWYFLPILLAGMSPWINRGVAALVRPGFSLRPGPSKDFDPVRFLWTYALFVLFFFSLGSSKLAGYILPMFPAIALLAGRKMADRPSPHFDSWAKLTTGAILLIAVPLVDLSASERTPAELLQQFRPWLLVAALVSLAGFLIMRRHGLAIHWRITVMAFSALMTFQVINWGFQVLGESRSSRSLVEAIRPYTSEGAPVYNLGVFHRSLPFYLGRPVVLAMTKSELQLGIEQEPEKWIPDWQTFMTRWKSGEQAVAVMRRNDYPSYRNQGLSGRVVYQDARQLAVVKQ